MHTTQIKDRFIKQSDVLFDTEPTLFGREKMRDFCKENFIEEAEPPVTSSSESSPR